MQKRAPTKEKNYTKARRRRTYWRRTVTAMAAIVVFCTIYALILPAITLEKQKDENSWETAAEQILNCTLESLQIHSHTDSCRDEEGNLICGYADYVVHQHESSCYDEEGNLRCTLPEIKAHTHDDSCYTYPKSAESHEHTAACYTSERGELICQQHEHTEECIGENDELNLDMGEETDDFSDIYYEDATEYICGIESDHHHTDACYQWNEVLICQTENFSDGEGFSDGENLSTVLESAEPELTCTEPEIILHKHSEECYDKDGNLICGKLQVLEHQHTEECFTPSEITVDTEALDYPEEETEPENADVEVEAYADETGVMVVSAEDETEQPTISADESAGLPLKENQITKAVLSYKTEDSAEWTVITGNETSIPGNASFKLEVDFDHVNIQELIDHGYKLTYTLPELFRDVTVSAKIVSGGQNVGDMTVENGAVILKFDETWLKNPSSSGDQGTTDGNQSGSGNQGTTNDSLNGSFYVEAKANLSQIPSDGKTEIVVGNTTIKINFDSDLVAKYGNVEIEKTLGELEQTEDGDFLNYTLTVTAGEDGCPEVKVVDSFTAGQNWAAEYVISEVTTGVEITEATDNNGEKYAGIFTWTIGDMTANETRTLTYRVKLKEGYLGVLPKDAITNSAIVYSKEYTRDTDTATFTPKAKATMSKVAGEFTPDENGGGTIQYTVWVKALDENNYVLDNVTIWDALDGSVTGGNKTDEKFLQYLLYDDKSFRLYKGGANKQNGSDGLEEITDAGSAVISTEKKSFTYNVGNLAPGECKTLVYVVKVDAGVFAQSNEDFKIQNRATILSDPSRTDGGNQRLENYNESKEVTSKKWARKLLGEEIEQETTVTMSGKVCDTSGNTTNDTSFTIPAGSYQYQVVVNEAGDWDVSSAVMKDNLGENGHMHYVGYVQVNAYEISSRLNHGSDDAAAKVFSEMTPTETVWVKVDQGKSFEFTPGKVGLAKDNYAYLLTYYAVPEYLGDLSSVIVANQFNLTGTVGINGKYYVLGGINVSASVTLQGGNYFSTFKKFWYYDRNANESDATTKGTLYWVVQVQGKLIPSGTLLKDDPESSNYPHKVGNIVGAFTADTIEDFSQYSDWSALQECTGFNTFDKYKNVSDGDSDGTLQWELTEEVRLDDSKSLYFIVATYPTTIPEANGASQKYSNELYTKDPGENKEWIHQSGDIHYIVGGDNLYKEMAEVFKVEAGDTAEGTKITCVQGDEKTVLQNDYLMKSGSGIYVAWRVYVNHASRLSGSYRINETIPDGMDVVYIQRYSTAERPGPTFAEISELDASESWKKIAQTFSYQDGNPTQAIYYVNGQEVVWEIKDLKAYEEPGKSYVDYLVVCKLTDSEVLLKGETKTFNNEVTLTDQAGKELGTDTDGVELSAPKLSKTGTYDSNINGGRYPFEINLNELGTDLVPGADKINLIDEMCDALILDPATIKVINTKTQEEVSFTSAIEGHKLTLTIPDDQPLTITYEAAINAAPGQTINITNNAHWEGYATTGGSSVKNENFSYAAGATVGTTASAKLKVLKVDQYDTGLKLPGAKFKLQEMTFEIKNSQVNLAEAENGLEAEGTTDEKGELNFDVSLDFNTVYRLTETEAPAGYVLDSTPHYFVIAKQLENKKYPDFLSNSEFLKMVYVHYNGVEYTYTALNHKGEIQVTKKFKNADGSPVGNLSGTYTFGLYMRKQDISAEGDSSEEVNSGIPDFDELELVKKTTIQYANNTVTPTEGYAKFTNVELGKTYYVYELDDKGNPINAAQEGIVSGIPFVVSYDKNKISVSADSSVGNITVTNRMNYAELPNTGGTGMIPYTAGGAALMAASLGMLYLKARRRKEEKISS